MVILSELPRELQWDSDWKTAFNLFVLIFENRADLDIRSAAREWFGGFDDEKKASVLVALLKANTKEDIMLGMQTLSGLPKELQQDKHWRWAVDTAEAIFEKGASEDIRQMVRDWIAGLEETQKALFVESLLKAKKWKDVFFGMEILGGLEKTLQREKDWERTARLAEHLFGYSGYDGDKRHMQTWISALQEERRAMFIEPLLKAHDWSYRVAGMKILCGLHEEHQKDKHWERVDKEIKGLTPERNEMLLDELDGWNDALDIPLKKLYDKLYPKFIESVKNKT